MTGERGRRRRPSALRAVPAPRRLADLAAVDSDALLAVADPAVEAVAAVLPARSAVAARVGLPPPPTDRDGLLARHGAQRGIRFAALARGAADLRAAAAQLRARHRALADEAGTLWERWSGPSADEVADRVVLLGRAAAEIVSLLEDTAEVIEAAGLAVADDVAARAAAAAELEVPAEPGTARGPRSLGSPATGATRAWAAALDARLHRYLEVADRTDRAIAATWRDLADRLAVLRSVARVGPGSDPDPAAGAPERPGEFPADLLALPEILAALGPFGPDGDDPFGGDDDPSGSDDDGGDESDGDDDGDGDGGPSQTVDDSR